MKFELKKTWHLLLCLVGGFIVISIFAFLFIAFMYRLNEIPLLNLIIPNGAEVATPTATATATPTATPTNSAETLRNFAWLFWMFLSLSGAGLGLWLAWRGRQIQQESHLQERFEKAADMLSSKTELTRIAGCRSLMNLGKSDDSMKSQCVRLLFAFISEPYLEGKEKEEYTLLRGRGRDDYLTSLFDQELLRPDIQAAVNGFSGIYEHYGENGVDSEVIWLPEYFWRNYNKGKISIIKAILMDADLGGASLYNANFQGTYFLDVNLEGADLVVVNFMGGCLSKACLQGANLHLAYLNGADLSYADLQGASLQDATISNADMRKAVNLTKEQILSAQWGDADLKKFRGRPQLPEYLMEDEDIKKWLEKPTFGMSRVGKMEKIRHKIRKIYYFFR